MKSITKILRSALFLGLLLCNSADVSAQDETNYLPNIVPPSPTAYALGNYGNIPVGMVTGAPNIDVPLIVFRNRNINVPINIFYGSNGIRVDDIASKVGLGWNINAGGVITRAANDIADEKDHSYNVVPPDSDLEQGIYTSAVIDYLYNIGNNNSIDSEVDMFSFNFNGNSGKFVLDRNGYPLKVENQNVKIEKVQNGNILTFAITTNDGVKYFFEETESTTFRSQGAGHSIPETYTTVWYLNKIVHPLGDQVNFEYEAHSYRYTASQSQSLTISSPFYQASCTSSLYSYGPFLSTPLNHTMTINGKRLTKIYSNNNLEGQLVFNYESGNDPEMSYGNNKLQKIIQRNAAFGTVEELTFSYTVTTNKRTFLSQITFRDLAKKFNFTYLTPEVLPTRLNMGQDHWGYFNGAGNQSLIAKVSGLEGANFTAANREPNFVYGRAGLLSKICYPTKGCSEIDYEPNRLLGPKVIPPHMVSDAMYIYNGPQGAMPGFATMNYKTMTVPFGQMVAVGGYGEFNYDECTDSQNTGFHHVTNISVFNITDNQNAPLYVMTQGGYQYYGTGAQLSVNSSYNSFYFSAQPGKTYRIGFVGTYRCTAGTCTITWADTQQQTIYVDQDTGGSRVKSIKDTDNNNVATYKRYYYNSASDLNKSSGISSGQPYYSNYITRRDVCTGTPGSPGSGGAPGCLYTDITLRVISSSSIIPIFEKGNNIFYERVTVSYGDDDFKNGGEEHQYTIQFDTPGEVVNGMFFPNAGRTNSGWNHGQEKKSIIYKKGISGSLLPVKENTFEYFLDDRIGNGIHSYAVRKNFNLLCYTPGQMSSIENIDVMATYIRPNWFYLKKAEEKSFFYDGSDILSGTNLITKNFKYNNVLHTLLSEESVTVSAGETMTTKHFYPEDAEMASEQYRSELIAKFMTGTELKTEHFRNSDKVQSKKTEYGSFTSNSFLLPLVVYAGSDDLLESKVSFDYDNWGNIQEFRTEGSAPVSIIWGYNKSLPIAKIDNASILQIGSILGVGANGVQNLNENNLSQINGLRNSLPIANTTTMEFEPIVGLKASTDPKGEKTTYEYDQYNRLIKVKDNDNNVLTENIYNYRP